MNIPNLITVGRFFLIPLYLVLFFSGTEYANLYAFTVLVLAGLSDILDGYLARRNNQITETGKLLDPLADKCMMLAVIFSFVIDQRISWIAAGIIFFRDFVTIISSAFFHFRKTGHIPAANLFGKATTVLFYIAFLMIMFELPYHSEMLWFTIAFAFFTSMIYIMIFVRFTQQKKAQSRLTELLSEDEQGLDVLQDNETAVK